MRWFFPLFVFVWLGFTPVPDAHSLDKVFAERFKRNLQIIIRAHPSYKWGGSTSERDGLDCSGYIYLAAKRSAWPVYRTTAHDVALGNGGWKGYPITLNEADECDLCFWRWVDKYGHQSKEDVHMGALLRDDDGLPAVTHSGSRGVVRDQLRGKLLRDMTKVKHLTIGDKR